MTTTAPRPTRPAPGEAPAPAPVDPAPPVGTAPTRALTPDRPAPALPLDPDWWRSAVVYQVYPRSFADADGDGLGDLRGLTVRIDYLAELGVDALWLSPFYPSPLADGGYDVADYRDVDPRLGTLEDFDDLVAAAHARGIRIVVDLVPNHTSEAHPWFAQALAAAPGSAERERYVFRDGRGPDGEQPPTNWVSHFGGPAWTRITEADGRAGQWYLHLFAREQPDLNWENPEVRADFETTLRFWGDRGVDGFRVDVAHGLAKDLAEPLRDRTGPLHPTVTDGSDPLFDRDEVHAIYRSWRRILDEYDPPLAAVAEVWAPVTERVYLYAHPEELGQAFDFSLVDAPWDAGAYLATIRASLAGFAAHGGTTWVLSNHDIPRHASRLALPAGTDLEAWLASDGATPPAEAAVGLRRARAASLLMLFLPGAAYLYQGEELGLGEVADLRPEELRDPIWERSGHTLKGRDGARVPLPWTPTGTSLGFGPDGGAAPWLPQPAWFAALSVEAQAADPGSTLAMYRRALAMRRALPRDTVLEWTAPDEGAGEVVDLSRPVDPAGARDLTGTADPSRPAPASLPSGVLDLRRSDGTRCVVNFSERPTALPDGRVLVASGPLPPDGTLPGETAVWIASDGGPETLEQAPRRSAGSLGPGPGGPPAVVPR